jgi:nitrogen-specific signal transduction histidine kinase
MKPEVVFVLENAAWPAFLVEAGGTVRRSNRAAVQTFGSVLEGHSALLSSIWGSNNTITPEAFLNQPDFHWVEPANINLAVKGGGLAPFRVYVAPLSRDGQRYLLIQALKPVPNAAGGAAPSGPRPVPAAVPVPAPAPSTPPQTVEAGLAQRQKLECALQLARAVTLDFNNALTSILGHTSLILDSMEPGSRWRESMLEVEKSAERAAEIVSDLASFSRQEKDTGEKAAGNLNELLQRTVGLFKAGAGAQATWVLHLEDQVYSAKFDEAKMQQAFVKILENAVQAIQPKGRIQIDSRNLRLEEPLHDGTAQVAPGCYVCVEVNDGGCGIAPADLPRIFEPFFTTKPNPPHRGLGLAWAYGIVTNHGGSIAVSSQPGAGASVRVYVPAEERYIKDRSLKSADLTGHQTLLMVDDEDLVLTMGQTILSAFGYHVLVAANGARAMELISANPDRIDLVITDLVMPNMSGRELIEHLRVLAPRVRILCTSGYPRGSGLEGEVAYLKKPFTSQELLRRVKQALE